MCLPEWHERVALFIQPCVSGSLLGTWILEAKRPGFESQLCPRVTLGKSFCLPASWSPHLRMEMIVALTGLLQGPSAVIRGKCLYSRALSQGQGYPSTCRRLSCYLRGSPEEEGKSSSLLALCRFLSLFLFSRLLEDQKGICLLLFCLAVGHSICVYPPGSFPRVGLTDDPLCLGQGTQGYFRLAGLGPPKSGGSRWP